MITARHLILNISIGASLLIAPGALAQTTFDTAVAKLLAANPELKAAEADMRADLASRRADASLPDLDIEGGYEWGARNVGDKWNVGISQSFDWPGVYASKNKALKTATTASLILAESMRTEKKAEISELLIDYVYTKRRIEIAGAIQSRLEELVLHYNKAYANGEATILDVNAIRISLFEAQSRYTSLQNELAVVTSSIVALGNTVELMPEVADLQDYPSGRLYTHEEYMTAVAETDPAMRHADLLEQVAHYDLEAARRSRMPGFSIGYSHICELGDHFNGLSVGLSLPVFSGKHKVAEATSLMESASLRSRQMRVGRMAAVTSDFNRATTLATDIENYRDVALDPRPAQLLDKALSGGAITVFAYIEQMNYFDEARMTYDAMLYEYHRIVARMNRYMQ